MIRFLQTPGPIKKAVLGSMLLVIAAAMVITLVPGGFDFFTASGGGGRGTLAKVAGQDVTTYEVEQLARLTVQTMQHQPGALLARNSTRLQQRGDARGVDIADPGQIEHHRRWQ